MEYILTLPIPIFFLADGRPASNFYAIFYDKKTFPALRSVYYKRPNGFFPAPNPMLLNYDGTPPETIYYKVADEDDKYTIHLSRFPYLEDIPAVIIDSYPLYNKPVDDGNPGNTFPTGYPNITDTPDSGPFLTRVYDAAQNPIAINWSPSPVEAVNQTLSNGIVDGCIVNRLASTNSVSISAGTAIFMSSATDPPRLIQVAAVPKFDVTFISSSKLSYIYLGATGNFFASEFANEAGIYGEKILIAILDHASQTEITRIIHTSIALRAPEYRFSQFVKNYGGYRCTCRLGKNGEEISMKGGVLYGYAVNPNDRLDYGSLDISAKSPITFRIRKTDGSEGTPFTQLTSSTLIKEDGTQVSVDSYAYFPVFFNPDGDFLIQAAIDEYPPNSIPEYQDVFDNFLFNPNLIQNYPNIAAILYKGGTNFSEDENLVKNLGRQFGDSLSDISVVNLLPEIPQDGSKKNALVAVGDGQYILGAVFDVSKFSEESFLGYDPVTGRIGPKVVQIQPSVIPSNKVSSDRIFSEVYQDHGTLKQRKSSDFVPFLITQHFDWTRYKGNYLFDVSRCYNVTATDSTPAGNVMRITLQELSSSYGKEDYSSTDQNDHQKNFYSLWGSRTLPNAFLHIDEVFIDHFNWWTPPPGRVFYPSSGSGYNNFLRLFADEYAAGSGISSSLLTNLKFYGTVVEVDTPGLEATNTTSDPIKIKFKVSANRHRMVVGSEIAYVWSLGPCTPFFVMMNDKSDKHMNFVAEGTLRITDDTLNSPFLSYNTGSLAYGGDRIEESDGFELKFLTSNDTDIPLEVNSNLDLEPGAYGHGITYAFQVDSRAGTGSMSAGGKILDGIDEVKKKLRDGLKFRCKFSNQDVATYVKDGVTIGGNKKVFCMLIRPTLGRHPQFSAICAPLIIADDSIPDGYRPLAEVEIDIFATAATPTKNFVQLDFGTLSSYNISASTDPLNIGLQKEDITLGTVLFTLIIKPKTDVKKPLDFNPVLQVEPYPLVSLDDGSTRDHATIACVDVNRLVYSYVIKDQATLSKKIHVTVYGYFDKANLDEDYDLNLGVCMRDSLT